MLWIGRRRTIRPPSRSPSSSTPALRILRRVVPVADEPMPPAHSFMCRVRLTVGSDGEPLPEPREVVVAADETGIYLYLTDAPDRFSAPTPKHHSLRMILEPLGPSEISERHAAIIPWRLLVWDDSRSANPRIVYFRPL